MEPGRQLAMFMTPQEIKDTHEPNDRREGEVSSSRIWNRKLRESKNEKDTGAIPVKAKEFGGYETVSLHEHIKRNVVSNAVMVGNDGTGDKVYDGHHRVASAADTRPNDLIPVVHSVNAADAFDYRSRQKKAAQKTKRAIPTQRAVSGQDFITRVLGHL